MDNRQIIDALHTHEGGSVMIFDERKAKFKWITIEDKLRWTACMDQSTIEFLLTAQWLLTDALIEAGLWDHTSQRPL